MSAPTYSPEQVQTTLALVQEALEEAVKYAGALETENAELKQKVAHKPAPEVVLEKVAFAADQVKAAVASLVEQQVISQDQGPAFERQLLAEPEFALNVIQKLANTQAPATAPGHGIPRTSKGVKTAAAHAEAASWLSPGTVF